MEKFEDILVERNGDVEILTINRPQARNALTFNTYDELERAVRSTTSRCLVITGVDPAFCSGDDVKAVMANPAGNPADRLERPEADRVGRRSRAHECASHRSGERRRGWVGNGVGVARRYSGAVRASQAW